MGWASGGDIFDPVAREIVYAVSDGLLDLNRASTILEVLIDALQSRDWDTEEESLEQFEDIDWIVAAFKRCNVPYEE
jgi:hypothetical protein